MSPTLDERFAAHPGPAPGREAAVAAARERIIAQGGSFSSDSPAGRRVLRATLPLAAGHA